MSRSLKLAFLLLLFAFLSPAFATQELVSARVKVLFDDPTLWRYAERVAVEAEGALDTLIPLFGFEPPPITLRVENTTDLYNAVAEMPAKYWQLRPDDVGVLEAALRVRSDLPFACRGGVCGTCRAQLVEGTVTMDANYALEPEEIAQGYVLTCQSHPTSPRVVLDYDA